MPRHVTGLTILIGSHGALYYRGATRFSGTSAEGGDLTALEIPADYAAQDAANTPYRLGVDVGSGLPAWETTTSASNAMTPTYIGPTETFTVPANRQALFAITIDNDGILDVVGDLVMVD